MVEYIKKLENLLEGYKVWIISNPDRLKSIENIARWSSFTLAGTVNKSILFSELVYCSASLVTLCNDIIISEDRRRFSLTQRDKVTLKKRNVEFALTVLNVVEVFVEILLREKYSNRTKWTGITIIQLLKLMANMYLILKHNCVPLRCPPAPIRTPPPVDDARWLNEFSLSRSHRGIKKLEPSNWSVSDCSYFSDVPDAPDVSAGQLKADLIYAWKPIIHLLSMRLFGTKSWQQWIIPLVLDLISLRLHEKDEKRLNYTEKIEISRRKLRLLFYLMRSPLFEKFTETKLRGALTVASSIPLLGSSFSTFSENLSMFQNTYFYTWD